MWAIAGAAASKAKRLSEGNHDGTVQQPYILGCRPLTAASGFADDPPEYDSEDNMPSLEDGSAEHWNGKRLKVVPFDRFPAYTPPRMPHQEDEDRELLFAPIPLGHWASGVSLAIVRSVWGRV